MSKPRKSARASQPFRVSWVVDLDAASHLAAAREALATQRRRGSIAVVFRVVGAGRSQLIDLDVPRGAPPLILEDRELLPLNRGAASDDVNLCDEVLATLSDCIDALRRHGQGRLARRADEVLSRARAAWIETEGESNA